VREAAVSSRDGEYFDESKNGQEPTYYEDFGPEFYEGGGNAGFIYDHNSRQ
jgi:hypothetical protein